jgi:hypothetical protein
MGYAFMGRAAKWCVPVGRILECSAALRSTRER